MAHQEHRAVMFRRVDLVGSSPDIVDEPADEEAVDTILRSSAEEPSLPFEEVDPRGIDRPLLRSSHRMPGDEQESALTGRLDEGSHEATDGSDVLSGRRHVDRRERCVERRGQHDEVGMRALEPGQPTGRGPDADRFFLRNVRIHIGDVPAAASQTHAERSADEAQSEDGYGRRGCLLLGQGSRIVVRSSLEHRHSATIAAMTRAVVLLSGGLDSATVLAVARREGRELMALSFDYGQRHACELVAAREIAQRSGVDEHIVFPLEIARFGGSALTAPDIAVPKNALGAAGIPATYVPARNTVFLSIALAFAEARGADEIWLGVNAVDYSGYPDCRPEFLDAFQQVILKGTRSGIEDGTPWIVAPLADLSKAEIIRCGIELGVDYSITRSCYDPDPAGRACGACDSCLLRRRGFEDAGVADPTIYQ
jgi:7-cyano-7-deazaguanine synthase